MPVKSVKTSTKKKTTKKTSKAATAKKIKTATAKINSTKPKAHGPSCIHCHKTYDPAHPAIVNFKNNPGFCSVECGYLESQVDKKVRSPLVEAPSKPVAGREVIQGKSVPRVGAAPVLEPVYVPSEVAGKAISLTPDRTDRDTPFKVIDLTTGEALEQHPAELVLRDDTERYYSHSTIKALASCSAAVYYRKTDVKMTPAYALERGSAVHGALEQYQKFGRDPIEVFEENWKLMVLDKASLMKESDQEKIRLGYEESKRMIQEFVIENGEIIKKRSKPQDAEVEFSIVVPINMGGGTFKRRIYGKMDWVLWSADKKRYTILDYKTSGQAPPDNELDRDTQFAIYQLAGQELYGFPPDKMVFYYLKGQHMCGGRFSKDHPRPTTPEGMQKCLQFAFDIPIKTPEQIQAMIDTYYGPVILAHEIGLVTKNLSDARKCVSMCGYKEHCDKVTSLPMPLFARYA